MLEKRETDTDHLVGVFPLCDGGGARLAHHAVRVCFHCKLEGAQLKTATPWTAVPDA